MSRALRKPGQVRVVAGSAGGLRLRSPKRVTIRPTQDRIKEVIFSSLGDHLEGASVLDLFAGTGALGIEALSRGAASCTFVEKESACCEAIRENLDHCRLHGSVLHTDVSIFLRQSASPVDLVLADPPYDKTPGLMDSDPLLDWVRPWLTTTAILVWEHFAQQQFRNPPGWRLLRQRTYGETGLTMLLKDSSISEG